MIGILVNKIISLALVMAMGWLVVKSRVMRSEDSKGISKMSLYLVMPCVILSSFQVEYTDEVKQGLLLAFLAARETEYTNLRILLMGRTTGLPADVIRARLRESYVEGRGMTMAATYRIAVIGDWESVMGFRALGLDTYPVTSVDEAKERVRELAKTDCAIIYLTEQLAKDMEDVLARYKDELRPAIIMIPGREGSLGIGMNNIQRAIERAVGADIF